MEILQIEDLSYSFGDLEVLDSINLRLNDRRITAIIGPNGSGKSTLFNLINGILRLQKGKIMFNGSSLAGMKTHNIAKKGICRTFQTPQPLSGMTVLENVAVASKTSNELQEILEQCGLGDKANRDADSLSFTELRFLELARVMTMKPKLLLADEPFSGLNQNEIDHASNILVKMKGRFGTAVLISGHLVGHLAKIADEFIALSRGRIIVQGKFEEVRNNPEVITTYLGGSDAEN